MTNLEDDFPHKDFLDEAGKVLVISHYCYRLTPSRWYSVYGGNWHLGDVLCSPNSIPLITIWGETRYGVKPLADSIRLLIKMWGGDSSKLQIDFIDRGE